MADPASPSRPFWLHRNELSLRITSGLVLALLAIGTVVLGGWPFAVFWSLAAIGVLWEWTTLIVGGERRSVLMTGVASLVLALGLMISSHLLAAVIVLAMGTLGAAVLAPSERRIWAAGGIPYAGALAMAPILLRSDVGYGSLALIFSVRSRMGNRYRRLFRGSRRRRPQAHAASKPEQDLVRRHRRHACRNRGSACSRS